MLQKQTIFYLFLAVGLGFFLYSCDSEEPQAPAQAEKPPQTISEPESGAAEEASWNQSLVQQSTTGKKGAIEEALSKSTSWKASCPSEKDQEYDPRAAKEPS